MARQLEHALHVSVEAIAPISSTTVDAIGRGASGEGVEVQMFGDVDPAIQLKMELLARASASPETALPFVIALLVEGDERRDAIVTAIFDNDALREQWHRTWEVLRR
jgi:hypothetical protein